MKKILQGLVFVLRRLLRRRARNEKVLPDPGWAAEVQVGLSFLFKEHGASLVDSSFRPCSFGLKTAVIEVGHILLKVSRDATLPTAYVESRIAPVHALREFRGVQTAWIVLQMRDQTVPPTPPYNYFGTLPGLAKSLQEILPKLNEAFSEANYPTMKARMEKVEQGNWRRWEQEQSEISSRDDRRLTGRFPAPKR